MMTDVKDSRAILRIAVVVLIVMLAWEIPDLLGMPIWVGLALTPLAAVVGGLFLDRGGHLGRN